VVTAPHRRVAGTPGLARAVARGALAGLLAVACAASGPGRPDEAPADAARGDVRQAVEELRREVGELRAQLQLSRRIAARQEDLAGLREELRAVQAALQALVRDVEQRQREAVEGLERRVAAVAARLGELEAREPSSPAAPAAASPPPPAAAPGTPTAEPPVASGQPSVIRRVQPTQAVNETTVGIEADGPLSARAFTLAEPIRLVVDFENTAYGLDRAPVTLDGPVVERLRFIQLRGLPNPVSRLVLYLRRSVPHWIETQPRGVIIHLGASGPTR
jgi:AMIN domain